MDAIVSVTADWGIGYKGKLLVPNRQDMARFRAMTEGSVVICGRSTYDSFPAGPLPNRCNVVISSQRLPPIDGVIQARNIDEATRAVSDTSHNAGHVWVIGGASIYQQMLPMCIRAYVTKHDVTLPADTYFPNLDEDPGWHVVDESVKMVTDDGVPFRFMTYENACPIG